MALPLRTQPWTIERVVPLLAGILLDAALDASTARLDIYRVFFVGLGLAQALSFLPLRAFRKQRGV